MNSHLLLFFEIFSKTNHWESFLFSVLCISKWQHTNGQPWKFCTEWRHTTTNVLLLLISLSQQLPVSLQSKMQTDQDAGQQAQADVQKETEEKTPQENEEMDVRFMWNEWIIILTNENDLNFRYAWPYVTSCIYRRARKRTRERKSPTSPHKPKRPKSKLKCWSFLLRTVHSGS